MCVAVRLAAGEADACRRAAAACGMTFTGLDLRRRPDGGFAVLECNPSPMFAGIQRRTGAEPVSDALAELLLGGRRASMIVDTGLLPYTRAVLAPVRTSRTVPGIEWRAMRGGLVKMRGERRRR